MKPHNPTDPPVPEPDPEELLRLAAGAVEAEEKRDLLRSPAHLEERLRSLEEGRRQLERLLDVSLSLNQVGPVEDLLERILEHALQLSGADRAYVLRPLGKGKLEILASRTREGGTGSLKDLEDISHTILDQVLRRGQTLYVSDALNNPDFMSRRSVQALSLRTVVCVPLAGPSGVTGALYVDSQRAVGLLGEEGVRILEAFAAQAAIALETASHRRRLEETAQGLAEENRTLRQALGRSTRFESILGESPAMQKVFQVLERVVDHPVSVLIQGETGTGKELVARALHFQGPRREKNFIPVNCGAIPEALLESELFGHTKGAFTGADRDRSGLLEEADGGTLFLDEIGEMPLSLQVKLLRVLQDGEVRRVGARISRRVDVRILAASNRDLREEVKGSRFREDLYYRINVVTIYLPPLRDRERDALILAERHLESLRERRGRPDLQFAPDSRRLILSHTWPGNVRELINAVERGVAMARGSVIEPEDLLPGGTDLPPAAPEGSDGTLRRSKQAAEEAAIRDALREMGGVVARAARRLGVSRQHLHTRMRKLGIRASD